MPDPNERQVAAPAFQPPPELNAGDQVGDHSQRRRYVRRYLRELGMPSLTVQEEGLTRRRPVPPTALGQVLLKPLPQVLAKAASRPPDPGFPGWRVSPHVYVGSVTGPLLWAAALGVSLTTGCIAPASPQYDRLTPVARVAGPRCLAGHHLLGCVPARLSSVASMASGDVCHGPQSSPARLGPVALEYRSCYWPGGSAWSPQCVRPRGCRPLCPFLLLPSVHVCVRCPGPLGACSPMHAMCVVCVCCWLLPPPSAPPLIFFSLLCSVSVVFFMEKGPRAQRRHRHGQLVQRCSSVMSCGVRCRCFVGGVSRCT